MADKSLHSICRWTFNPGKGGFVPGDMRPEWGGTFGTLDMISRNLKLKKPKKGAPCYESIIFASGRADFFVCLSYWAA